jgi:hypothetical protein
VQQQSRVHQHVTKVFENGGRKSAAILIDRRKIREKHNLFYVLSEVRLFFFLKGRLHETRISCRATTTGFFLIVLRDMKFVQMPLT